MQLSLSDARRVMKIRGNVVSLSLIFPHPPEDKEKEGTLIIRIASTAVVVHLLCRYVQPGSTGTIAATGTTPQPAATGISDVCHAVSQAL